MMCKHILFTCFCCWCCWQTILCPHFISNYSLQFCWSVLQGAKKKNDCNYMHLPWLCFIQTTYIFINKKLFGTKCLKNNLFFLTFCAKPTHLKTNWVAWETTRARSMVIETPKTYHYTGTWYWRLYSEHCIEMDEVERRISSKWEQKHQATTTTTTATAPPPPPQRLARSRWYHHKRSHFQVRKETLIHSFL